MKAAANSSAWAIGQQRRNGFHVRRIVWGRFMAQAEQRKGEEIRAASISVAAPKIKRTAAKANAKRKAEMAARDGDEQLPHRRNDLKYFDQLPDKLREFLNDTNLKHRSHAVFNMFYNEGMSCRQVIEEIRRGDQL
jgi:hypothetical protein